MRPLIASMATLALNSILWVRRLINSFGEGYAYVGSPLNRSDRTLAVSGSEKGADVRNQPHLQHRITGGWVVAIPVVTAAAGRILRGRSSAPAAAMASAPLVRPCTSPHSGAYPANRPPGIP